MRNRNTKSDSGTHSLFSLPKRLQDRITISALNMSFLDQKINQFHDRCPPLGGFHFGDYLINR
jgi:hypothetical protein